MKTFSQLNIAAPVKNFEGDKISIESVVDKNITVLAFKIEESKYTEKGNGKCLYLQLELNGEKRVLFSGSAYLMETLKMIPAEDIPFTTIIVKKNRRLEFS